MKHIIFTILVLLSMFSTVKAEEKQDPTKWTLTDTMLQVVFTGLLEVDRQQTQWIASHPIQSTEHFSYTTPSGAAVWGVRVKYRKEANSMIGQKAHPDRINAYFATAAVGHAVVSYALPHVVKALGGSDSLAKYSRTIWQSTWIVAETHTVSRNYAVGVKMTF